MTKTKTVIDEVVATTRRLEKAQATVAELRAAQYAAIRQAVAEGSTLRAVAALAGMTHNGVAKIVNQGKELDGQSVHPR